MASPPAAATDPRRPGQYTLKIGKGLKSGSTSASFSGVKFNHKPSLSNGSRLTKLSRTSDKDATLSIKDEESGHSSKYIYQGRISTSRSSYVLIFDPETQSCTLEPLKSSYNFNLTSTPWETSEERLSRQYEQLNTEEAAAHGDLDEDVDGEPDADNPYDFRHYLHLNSRPSPSPSPALKPTSTVGTSHPGSTKPSSNTTAPKTQPRPANKVDPLRQAPRKQKSSTNTGKAAEQRPTPTVRLDRRASTRPGDVVDKKVTKPAKNTFKSDYYVRSSDDDDDDIIEAPQSVDIDESGGLQIDWGNDKLKKKPISSRALELPDTTQDGPISLHSAANSPAGRIVPRQQRRKQHDYEQDVIDFGASEGYEDDEEEESRDVPQPTQSRRAAKDEDVHMGDVDESDGDADVEPMELGSPAHHQQSVHEPEQDLAPEDEVDFDDDLEAQMMAAMEQEEEQMADEESDVSEAE